MPYLSTSQDFLRESSQLLAAYPDTTRITTTYSYPKPRSSSSQQQPAKSQPPPAAPTEPATLTLKTYHPTTGICLKYRTDKAAEVGRLIAGLGKLAAGAPVEDVSSTVAAPVTVGASRGGEADEVEMVDVSASAPAYGTPTPAPAPAPAAAAAGGSNSGVSKGGKGKKKGGKGKK